MQLSMPSQGVAKIEPLTPSIVDELPRIKELRQAKIKRSLEAHVEKEIPHEDCCDNMNENRIEKEKCIKTKEKDKLEKKERLCNAPPTIIEMPICGFKGFKWVSDYSTRSASRFPRNGYELENALVLKSYMVCLTIALHVLPNLGVEVALMCLDSLRLLSCAGTPHVGSSVSGVKATKEKCFLKTLHELFFVKLHHHWFKETTNAHTHTHVDSLSVHAHIFPYHVFSKNYLRTVRDYSDYLSNQKRLFILRLVARLRAFMGHKVNECKYEGEPIKMELMRSSV
ncbi:hypothetical protein M9H77_22902 [Catharanthus roseus]|uniref:Uncharacterized protein n=1 Tax=Catharanthus roseus TaxID=4058 RepID=A0ACC0ARR8_CATRO|nr:hypothetical protein M9H77_22902 [Catharanthus roseus]